MTEGSFRLSSTAPDVPGITHLTSADIDDARSVLTQFLGPVAIGVPGGPDGFKLDLELIRLGPVTVAQLGFGSVVTLIAPEPAGYRVVLPLAGPVQARHAGREVQATPRRAAVLGPGRATFTRHDEHSTVLDVRIGTAALEAELSAMLGREVAGPIDLAPAMDLTCGPGQSWSRLLHLVRAELGRPDSLAHRPQLAAQLRDMLVSGLLLSVRHRHLAELTAPAQPGPPRAIRRVVDAIHDEPERPFDVAELARVAGISVRSLQQGFRRHLGSPPMAYLQMVRLKRVHETLLRADPARTTVAATAHRWGFAHLGRFASAYRSRYGVTPSETLARRA